MSLGTSASAAVIRPMSRADLPSVLDAWHDLIRTGQAADPRFAPSEDGREAYRAYLLQTVFGAFHPFPPAWVAAGDAGVVAFLLAAPLPLPPTLDQPPTARILDLWVHPDHRRRGVGRSLVQTFCARARSRGHPWIEVGTLARDRRATAFWRSLGFDDWKVVLLQPQEA